MIPTRNSAADLEKTIRAARAGAHRRPEIVVADGGSSDATEKIARRLADGFLQTGRPNRGEQLREAARASSGEFLLFLHADTLLPSGWDGILERVWRESRPDRPLCATAFTLSYDSDHPYHRLFAACANLRSRLSGVPFGDQAISTTRELYEKTGGVPPIPLMEDVEFIRRLRRFGRVKFLPEKVVTSARRLRRRGPLRNALRNQWILLRYLAGEPPEHLWGVYYNLEGRIRHTRRGQQNGAPHPEGGKS